ncbi:MAG TPA: LUD domain-containing protein [Verrucomicrobiota bacterium]|nr:LUD domain-containing protein [Verrucomicrobiota bacterium]
MSERDNIFARIKEALTHKAHAHHGRNLPSVEEQRRVMPPVGATREEQFALFAKNAGELKATFKWVKDEAELVMELKALAVLEKWQRAATHNSPSAQASAKALALPTIVTDDGYDKHELEKCDVGISECDALIAQTGTVLVTSRSAGGRALSCLPPHHVVIARRDQMVPDLPAAMALVKQKYGGNHPSMISFITGPSRTGDIERILVLGAHGPKKLTIICC